MLGVSVLGRARGEEVTSSGSGFESQLCSFLTLTLAGYLSFQTSVFSSPEGVMHSFIHQLFWGGSLLHPRQWG